MKSQHFSKKSFQDALEESRYLSKCSQVGHLGRQVGQHSSILAPTWLHVRSSWALVVHLGPSWLHLGAHLGTTCSPKCSQDAQDAAKTSKSTLQTPIFNDFGINFEASFQIIFVCYRLCYSHLFLYLFILIFCFSRTMFHLCFASVARKRAKRA